MSTQLKDYSSITVGTTAVPVLSATNGNEGNFTPHGGFMIFADLANTGIIYVGSSLVSTTRYSAALSAGQSWSITGSAINGNKIYILGSAAGQIAHPSGV